MGRLSDNMRGAIMMMSATTFFALGDTCVKAIGTAMPLGQMLLLRGIIATIFVALIAWRLRGLSFSMGSRDVVLIAGRTLSEVGAAYFFLTALIHMPIANVTALLQTLPLTVTLGGALLFRERVGWRRWIAVALGFCGMLLIVQPGGAGFSAWSIYALIAVACVTVRDLLTRQISKTVPSLTVALIGVTGITLFGGIISAGQSFAPMDARLTWLLLGAAGFSVCAFSFSVLAMRFGDVSFTAPFRYMGLLAAAILGAVVFGEVPDLLTGFGFVIIVGAGVFTMLRERRVARQAKTRRT